MFDVSFRVFHFSRGSIVRLEAYRARGLELGGRPKGVLRAVALTIAAAETARALCRW